MHSVEWKEFFGQSYHRRQMAPINAALVGSVHLVMFDRSSKQVKVFFVPKTHSQTDRFQSLCIKKTKNAPTNPA